MGELQKVEQLISLWMLSRSLCKTLSWICNSMLENSGYTVKFLCFLFSVCCSLEKLMINRSRHCIYLKLPVYAVAQPSSLLPWAFRGCSDVHSCVYIPVLLPLPWWRLEFDSGKVIGMLLVLSFGVLERQRK